MNFGYIKTSDPHRLLLNFSDKVYLKGIDKYVTLSNLNICHTWNKKFIQKQLT